MSILFQAGKIGFQVVGELRRNADAEPNHLYCCYLDDAGNQYIMRRGILTIVAADGTVW